MSRAMTATMPSSVSVIGAGSWGTAFAGLVAPHAGEVRLWTHTASDADVLNRRHHNPRYLPNYELPHNVVATSDLGGALDGASAVVFSVPSNHLRDVAAAAAPFVGEGIPVVVLTKGIEPGTGRLMVDVVAEEIGDARRICALSGPNHAEEVCRGMLSAAVVAGVDASVVSAVKELANAPEFRVYETDDVAGVEVCGAVKNVIAIACGCAVGTGAGDNTLAMLMTRGLAEVSRVAVACGGRPITCMGLAGMGDLVVTCTSNHSRNRTFGQELAHGVSLEDYERRTHMVVEGARAAQSVYEIAAEHNVEVPITWAVHDVLYEGAGVSEVLSGLLERAPRDEFYGLGER